MDGQRSIIPAFPYENGLYWLFHEAMSSEPSRVPFAHPYYINLFGGRDSNEREIIKRRAAAVTALFDTILLASADAMLPDQAIYKSGDTYEHPDLRIKMTERHDRLDWDIAERLVKERRVIRAVARHRDTFQSLSNVSSFFARLVAQVRLSAECEGAILLGNDVFRDCYLVCVPTIASELGLQLIEDVPNDTLAMNEESADILGLSFEPAHLEEFAAIRMDKDVQSYAKHFQDIISTSESPAALHSRLAEAILKAADNAAVARNVGSAFEAFNSVMAWGSSIPVIGTVAKIASIPSDIGARVAKKVSSRNRWYTIGAKMHEVAIEAMIKRLRRQYPDL